MKDISDRIIEKIRKNKISTVEVADCLNKEGAIPRVVPVNRGHHCVGRVFLAYTCYDSNWELHEQVKDAPEGAIVVVETYGIEDRAVFGHLVSKYLLLYRGVSAIVVNGYLRDAHGLIKDNFPIWCKGVTPLGCYNRKNERTAPEAFTRHIRDTYEGAIAVADDSGCVVIPRDRLTEDFLHRLDFIELQEDIWYFCIDTKKWDTYQTVCTKNYLSGAVVLPEEYKEKYDACAQKITR